MDVSKIKKEIYEGILSGNVSKSIIDNLVRPDGSFLSKECELWDYKKTFEDTKDATLKTLKSIISFHNTYGGYLIFGVDEVEKDTSFVLSGVEKNLIDQQKLRGQFDRYFNQRLDLTYEEIVISSDKGDLIIGLLHIPKRSKKNHSIASIVDGVNSKGKVILEKDTVYIRKIDECKRVVSQADFEFLVSDRHFDAEHGVPKKIRKNIIEHNLPDKNFICPDFIGRFEILQELWSWLSDDFKYTNVLAADGGKGKTSIAYEFSQLIIQSGTDLFEQVIWLTAKKQQFKAVYNQYVGVPETHYKDLETLLKEVCLRTGYLQDEVSEFTLQQLQRAARDGLALIPSFVVVDDIDSNSPEEQKRIMEIARSISSTSSRVLMTTRANNIYSSDSSILVPGLRGKEYIELVNTLCDAIGLPNFNEKNIGKLNVASEGSPLFTESILRLCKLGLSLEGAIEDWSGKSGDTVREAALRKEVSELSPEAIKILLTICYVGDLSRSELHQYTDFENSEVNIALEQLGNLFLVSSMGFIEEEPRFESTSSISKLVLSIANEIVPNSEAYIKRIREIGEGLEANTRVHIPEVGAAVRQCNSLLAAERFSDSRNTVRALIKKPRFKENSDLYFILAKTDYEDPLVSDEVARKSFVEAFIKGQRKPAFFEMWYQTEVNSGSSRSILEVCESALRSIGKFDSQWAERCAVANYNQASNTKNYENKVRYLVSCYGQLSKLLKISKRGKWEEHKQLSVKVVDALWDESMNNSKYEIAGSAIINAVNGGDIRSVNFNRMIEVSHFFVDEKLVSETAFRELRDNLEWAPQILRSGAGNREPLAIKLEQTYRNMKGSMRNKKLKVTA
ncbi:ATP-binding protein [Shewanella pealeana]|uniref:Putative transcriptional regulator n=1 Tax=Shewanella pealeana (strain ATCC 700345 / ANG-SQ1) TaxID=398579 RepID=A8H1R1_SHEPA|nr:ATP-binding protein [Shewanella pealeana]ABV86498.1 putative transcriptional regulator [Shewanella pealeana ATCC 700345]